MKNLRNTVTLVGRLGLNPEVREVKEGKTVARLSIATDDSYRTADGEKVKNTQWHTVVAWNRNAKFAEKYLVKGNEVMIEGKLTHRTWEDKDGNKKYTSEIIANEFLLLGGK